MGNSTRFTLEVIPQDEMFYDIIDEFREQDYMAAYAIENDGSDGESISWYGAKDHLVQFSRRYPGHLFILRGEGEENRDIWVIYARNGKFKKHFAKIEFPEFDENELA